MTIFICGEKLIVRKISLQQVFLINYNNNQSYFSQKTQVYLIMDDHIHDDSFHDRVHHDNHGGAYDRCKID